MTEREREVSQLRTEIQQLEQIANRTAEQERELQEKKQRLAELERDKQQEESTKPTNWIPWIIGGVILVLAVGIIAYLLGKNKEK
jgi:cytochrome c-type biogenesis protein CcmH/NrfG